MCHITLRCPIINFNGENHRGKASLFSVAQTLARNSSREPRYCGGGKPGVALRAKSKSVARGENRVFDSQQEIGDHYPRKHDRDVVDNRIQVHPDSGNDIQ